jgi:hypothetical protein
MPLSTRQPPTLSLAMISRNKAISAGAATA